jgi:hypothetical protein
MARNTKSEISPRRSKGKASPSDTQPILRKMHCISVLMRCYLHDGGFFEKLLADEMIQKHLCIYETPNFIPVLTEAILNLLNRIHILIPNFTIHAFHNTDFVRATVC